MCTSLSFMLTIVRYTSLEKAHALKQKLEESGIECVVSHCKVNGQDSINVKIDHEYANNAISVYEEFELGLLELLK